MIFNPIQVTWSSKNMVLYFNGKNYPGLMNKPEPYKVKYIIPNIGKMQNNFLNNDKFSVFHEFLHVMLVCMV